MCKKKKYGIIALAALIVLVTVLGVCWYRAGPRVKMNDAEHAREVFSAFMKEADGILYYYNLSTESFITDELDTDKCRLRAAVPIDELRELSIELTYDPGHVPQYTVAVTRRAVVELEYCYSDLEEYTFLFDLASLVADNRRANGFESVMEKLKQRTSDRVARDGFDQSTLETQNLHAFFQYAGAADYRIEEREDGAGFDVIMTITGPLSADSQ